MLHPEIVDYLRDMITPGPDQGIEGVFIHAGSDYDWAQHEDASVHGIVLEDAGGIEEAYRVLKLGGHLMLVAPDEQPTGHTGACMAEDLGFEVRDAICIPGPGDGDKIHYVPKASRSEREEGLGHLPEKVFGMSGGAQGAIAAAEALAEEEGEEMDEADYEAAQTIGLNRVVKRRNVHPTIKCIGVMERLLSDIPTDQGPILDPFMGSGTTGIACLSTGHDFIGIEREEEYLLIAEGRVRHWNVRTAAWDTARVTSDLTAYEEAHAAEPETLDLDDLFGL
jgi:hypothetical protein